jgi:DNA-binding FrmR family transcriptional regulator
LQRAVTSTLDVPVGGIGIGNTTMMNDGTRKKVLSRLKRIAGQVGGIGRMVQDDRYCVDLLLQIASAQAALSQVNKLILRSHVETCMAEVMTSGTPGARKQRIGELMDVFAHYGGLGQSPA